MTTPTTTKPAAKRARRTSVPGPAAPAAASPALDELTGGDTPRLVQIPLARLHAHPGNPRRDVGDVADLAADIAASGLDQALVVVPHPDVPGEYRVVIGHRRRAACELAGLPTATCRIREDLAPAEQRQMMVRENVHRADLTAVEEADAYQAMLDIDGLTVDQVATAVSRSETTVRSRLRLARLPEPARMAVHSHAATLEDAASLEEFADEPELHEDLAAQLGTPDYRHALATARGQRELAALFAPLLHTLREAGATELGSASWAEQQPEGLRAVGVVWSYQLRPGSPHAIAVEFAAHAGEATSGWAFRLQGNTLALFRPLTLEEAQEEAERAESRTAVEVARREDAERRRAELAASQERNAALKVAIDAAAVTRGEFLRGFLTRTKLTAAEVGHVVEHVSWAVLDEETPWPYGSASAARLLGVDIDALLEAEEDDDGGAVDQAIAAVPPAIRLLAGLAAGYEDALDTAWAMRSPSARRWYALLEQLGYQVSDAERTLIAPRLATSGAE